MSPREKSYIAEQVQRALAGAKSIRGFRRVRVKTRSGDYFPRYRYAIKSTGRSGAAVRFYIREQVREVVIREHVADRQTPRKGAPRGSRRGTHKRPQRRAA